MYAAILPLLAYLIGSLSFAVLVSRLFGLPDPRTFGSRNPGATNVLRTGRRLAAALTLGGDAAKGWLAVFLVQYLASRYGLGPNVVAVSALAVFLGHVYPLFFGFQGGKGVATALGILLALNPLLGLGVLGTWLLAALIWRISSLSALIAAASAPLYALPAFGLHVYTLTVLGLSLLLVWRHKSNIRNLLAGTEKSLGRSERPGALPPE